MGDKNPSEGVKLTVRLSGLWAGNSEILLVTGVKRKRNEAMKSNNLATKVYGSLLLKIASDRRTK